MAMNLAIVFFITSYCCFHKENDIQQNDSSMLTETSLFLRKKTLRVGWIFIFKLFSQKQGFEIKSYSF